MTKEQIVTKLLIWGYTIRGWWRYRRVFRHKSSNGQWYYAHALGERFYHNDGFRFTKVKQYDCGIGVEFVDQRPMVLDYYKIGIFNIK